MIKVPFDPAKLTGEQRIWWEAWSARAAKKMADYLSKRAAGEACELDDSIWSDLKAWLLKHVFHEKCAYCEVHVTASGFGDAEHYRPKGNVTVSAGPTKRPVTLADGKPHDGYYWLAYDWRNLLPACTRCNNAKSDLFEVEGAHVADPSHDTSGLNAAERPFLLYPYEDDPSKHLRFGKNGVVAAIDGSPRGKATIRILGLDRRELTEERWREQARALEALEGRVGQLMSDENALATRAPDYMGPKAPFSRAIHDWFVERARLVSARAIAAAKAATERGDSR
jgi:uncharacterized protein (TIGR02646 family)